MYPYLIIRTFIFFIVFSLSLSLSLSRLMLYKTGILKWRKEHGGDVSLAHYDINKDVNNPYA